MKLKIDIQRSAFQNLSEPLTLKAHLNLAKACQYALELHQSVLPHVVGLLGTIQKRA